MKPETARKKNNDLLLTRRSSTHLQSQAEVKASEDENHPWLHSELKVSLNYIKLCL